jgi:two-component system OmpR family response regulator
MGSSVAEFRHILVVEGQPEVAEMLRNVLEHHGYRVSVAAAKGEAQSIFQSQAVDLLVADVALRSDTGIALAEDAEKIGIRSLLISGDVERMPALAAAPRPFIAKPFRLVKLVDRISEILAKPKD